MNDQYWSQYFNTNRSICDQYFHLLWEHEALLRKKSAQVLKSGLWQPAVNQSISQSINHQWINQWWRCSVSVTIRELWGRQWANIRSATPHRRKTNWRYGSSRVPETWKTSWCSTAGHISLGRCFRVSCWNTWNNAKANMLICFSSTQLSANKFTSPS